MTILHPTQKIYTIMVHREEDTFSWLAGKLSKRNFQWNLEEWVKKIIPILTWRTGANYYCSEVTRVTGGKSWFKRNHQVVMTAFDIPDSFSHYTSWSFIAGFLDCVRTGRFSRLYPYWQIFSVVSVLAGFLCCVRTGRFSWSCPYWQVFSAVSVLSWW